MDYKKTIKRFIKYNNKNGVKNYYFHLILLPKKTILNRSITLYRNIIL